MADALKLDITIDSLEADAALLRLAERFKAAGDDAFTAAEKVEKFEKSYKDGSARKAAKQELDALSGATGRSGEAAKTAASQTDGLTSAVMRYAAPAAVGAAYLSTIKWADSIGEMAERTSLTTTQVQQLSKMAEKNGSSFGAMASLIQNAEQRLAAHNKKAEEAVRLMGKAPEALLKMDPLERLRAIAQGLADIEDPAKRSEAEVALLGRSADTSAAAMKALANGADKVESALGKDFIRVGGQAADMLDTLTNKAIELGKAFLLLPAVMLDRLGNWAKDSTLGTAFEMMGFHGDRATKMPDMPKNGGWVPPTPTVGAVDPLGGNSQSFIERVLGIKKGKTAGGSSSAPATPYTANQWAVISQVLGGQNIAGTGGLGSFPGWAPMGAEAGIGGSPISFLNGMQLPGGVSMNAAGGGGRGFFSRNGMSLGLMAGGLAAQFLPGRVGQVAQGAMGMASQGAGLGAMFGPHGAAIGAGIGALVGGVSSLFGGNKAKKNAANQEKSDVFAQFSSKEFIEIQREADKLGISMEKALNAKTMKDFGAAVDEVTAKLAEMNGIQSEIDMLTEATTPNFEKMSALAKEFGIDINAMGNAFKQQAMDKDAQKIIDAMAYLEKGGADVNGVLDGMQDEISAVVQNSIKFGTTIPDNMKPWIQKLAESDRLVGENGEKITDISKLNFGTALESEMDKFVRKLGELIEKLAGVREGFDKSKEAAGGFNREANAGDYSKSDPNDNPVHVSSGGVIGGRGKVLYFKNGGFVPRGTDTVPAMLTPGEMVVSRDMVKGIARNGGRAGSVTVNLNIAGYLDSPKVQRQLAEVVTEAVSRDVRARRAG